MHEKVRTNSDNNNKDVVRKYGMPDMNEDQRTRATQIIEDVESETNMETLYAENNID